MRCIDLTSPYGVHHDSNRGQDYQHHNDVVGQVWQHACKGAADDGQARLEGEVVDEAAQQQDEHKALQEEVHDLQHANNT